MNRLKEIREHMIVKTIDCHSHPTDQLINWMRFAVQDRKWLLDTLEEAIRVLEFSQSEIIVVGALDRAKEIDNRWNEICYKTRSFLERFEKQDE